MKEDLLHYIWKHRLYTPSSLRTNTGEAIEVVETGAYNTNAGPDFSNSRIRIGEVLMAGNVEIHINASDWYSHHHDQDAGYNNVILHVVYEGNDKPTCLQNGQSTPVLILKDHISSELLNRYELLRPNRCKIPCEELIANLSPSFSLPSYWDRLVIERLQSKTAIVESMLKDSINDWDQVAFQMIAMYFGASVNKEPFALLAKSLPLSVIHKHCTEPIQIEALLFGQAGMLDGSFDDDYPNKLKREYNYLKKLHSLTSVEGHSLKFFRIRPANFPTIKIAQLAGLLIQEQHLFCSILESKSLAGLRKIFDISIHPYWKEHFQFDKPARNAHTSIGTMLSDVVLINAIVPLLFAYGRYKGEEAICERALEILNDLPAEDNAIIRMWDTVGIKIKAATDSQALIQLKNQYCDNKLCLQCQIGHKLLQFV